MKKGFGIFFIIIGSINLIIGFVGLPTAYVDKALQQIFIGTIFLALGSWMLKSADKANKEAANPTLDTNSIEALQNLNTQLKNQSNTRSNIQESIEKPILLNNDVLSEMYFICERCNKQFIFESNSTTNNSKDLRLDFKPIGSEKFSKNLMKKILSKEDDCQHSIIEIENSSDLISKNKEIINFSSLLKARSEAILIDFESKQDPKKRKQASLYLMYSSWFTNNQKKAYSYAEDALFNAVMYFDRLIKNDNYLSEVDIMYDLIFLDTARRQENKKGIEILTLRLDYFINKEAGEINSKYKMIDLIHFKKILTYQVKMGLENDTKEYNMSDIGINYLELISPISQFYDDQNL